MHVIESSCVDDALSNGLELIKRHGVLQDSRAGKVRVVPTPVMTVNHNPTHRVLFNPVRDANPVFHLMEALWMLAGRNDIKWLDQFVGDFSQRFGEVKPDGTVYQHGAYGFRWRKHFALIDDGGDGDDDSDQLERAIQLLRKDPSDRRVVLAMWDVEIDLGAKKKDIPCNTHIYLRVRDSYETRGGELCRDKALDLTVCCRSNDAIWGAHGANAVHFSILQEYLAARIRVDVGKLYQLSNNYHAYVDIFDKVYRPSPTLTVDRYGAKVVRTIPLLSHINVPDRFEQDLKNFCCDDWFVMRYTNDFFYEVALPLRYSYQCWREKNYQRAQAVVNHDKDIDWLVATKEWYQRRVEKSLLKGEQAHVSE